MKRIRLLTQRLSSTSSFTLILICGLTTGLAGCTTTSSTAPSDPEVEPTAGLSGEMALYLGVGNVRGSGTVVQVDTSGEEIGRVRLPSTPYGLDDGDGRLVAALPGEGVFEIDGQGNSSPLLENEDPVPHPIDVAVDGSTGDVIVADNSSDLIARIPAGQPSDVTTIKTIGGFDEGRRARQLQDLSVAVGPNQHILVSGSGGIGTHRFGPGSDKRLQDTVSTGSGVVGGHANASYWALVTSDEQVLTFRENEQIRSLPFPEDTFEKFSGVDVSPSGTPVVKINSLSEGDGRPSRSGHLYQLDLSRGEFKPLFSWDGQRIVSIAVAPKMDWDE